MLNELNAEIQTVEELIESRKKGLEDLYKLLGTTTTTLHQIEDEIETVIKNQNEDRQKLSDLNIVKSYVEKIEKG